MEIKINRKEDIQYVVDELIKLNDWYKNNYKTATLDMLTNCRAKLTTYLTTFVSFIGETKELYLDAERDRKLKHHEKRQAYIKADYSIASAEDQAIIDTKQHKEIVDKNDAYYTTLRLLLDQLNKVDDAISQHISTMKKEEKYSQSN